MLKKREKKLWASLGFELGNSRLLAGQPTTALQWTVAEQCFKRKHKQHDIFIKLSGGFSPEPLAVCH